MSYPIHIIASYRMGKISRQQFISRFSDWQKSCGIDYDCKVTARHGFIGVTYRGINATIHVGVIDWVCGEFREPKKGSRRFIRDSAKSVFEFCRKVDMTICDRLRGEAWI